MDTLSRKNIFRFNRKKLQAGFLRLTKKTLVMGLVFSILLPSIILYSLFIIPKRASAAWFDDNWAYRTSYSINNSGAAVTYQKVKIDIDTSTLITNGKIQSDCGDSRFTNEAGELLRYFLDSVGGACNTVSTDYYVLLPNIPANRSLIYHYYGNPAAQDGTEAAQFSEATFTPAAGPTAASEEKGTGPVGYWKFDEGYGTTTSDATPTNADGTISGATWLTEDMCLAGKCLRYDGTDDVTTVTNTSAIDLDAQLAAAFTASFWVRADGAGEGTGGQVFFKGTNTWLRVDTLSGTNLDVEASLDLATADATVNVSAPITTNTWYHIVMVYTDDADDEIDIYIDGKLRGSSTNGSGAPAADTNNLLIGGTTTNNFDGQIDEFKIYNYARTQAQINADFVARGASKGQGTVAGAQTQNLKGALSDGLVGYWRTNETSANTCSGGVNDNCDSSGNANDVAWNGNATSTGSGRYAAALSLDGTGDYAEIADNASLSITGNITLAAWVYRNTTTTADGIIGKYNSGAGDFRSYLLGMNTSAPAFILSSNGAATTSVTGTTTIAATTWYHIAATYDGSTMRIFVNGVQENSTAYSSGIFDSTRAFRIGDGDEGFWPFDGRIDEARVYNRALSPAEVDQLYNFAPGPVGYWNMDEKSGTTANDQSGNALTGTLNNGPVWTNGRYGSALSFDGSNDNVRVTDSATLQPSNVTVTAWVKMNAVDDGKILVDRFEGAGANNNKGYRFNTEATQTFRFIVGNGTAFVATSTTTYSVGTWYHLAGTFDGSSVRLYVNGILEATTGSAAMSFSALDLGIGQRFCSGCSTANINAVIDDVRIYSYARTAKQVIEDMNAGHPPVGTPLGSYVGYWKLDEGYGTTANDNSTNTNNLTLSAASWTNSGKFGKAWDGTGARWLSRADDADFDFAAAEDLTVSLWLKSDSATNPAATEYLFNKASATVAGYAVYVNTSGQVCFGIDDDIVWTPDDTACSTTDYYDAAWHHIVATKTGTTRIDLYVDGYSIASDTSIAATGTLANALTMYAGDRDGTDNADEFNGDIDEIKVYRAALTASEVKVEYNRGAGIVLGALGDSTTYQPQAANQEYCIPGDTTSCASPVSEWRLDEKSGTTANDTGTGANNGTITGPTWTQGKIGAGLSFDDSNDYVSIGDPTNLDFNQQDFTIEAWIKTTSSATGTIVGKSDEAAGTRQYTFQIGGGGALTMEIRDNGGAGGNVVCNFAGNTTTVNNNNWHHAVLVNDDTGTGTTCTLYLDGRSDGTGSTSFRVAADTPTLYIGRIQDGVYFGGIIDQVRIFDYVRTAAQIAYDYNRGAPVGWWKFDEGQTATANDSAITANNTAVANNGTISAGSLGITTVGDINTASTMWDNGQTGKYNYSLDYDGSDDVTTVTNATAIDLNTNSAYTFSAWINADGAGESSVGQVFQKGTTTYLRVDTPSGSNLDVEASLDLATTDATLNISAPITTASWNHIVVTYTDDADDEITIYINGLSRGSSTDGSGAPAADTNNLLIGGTTTANFDGRIDDFRMYNYEMTAAQVRDLYNHGAVRFGPSTGTP